MPTHDQHAPSTDLGIPIKVWIGFLFLFQAWNIYRTAMVIQDLVAHRDPRWKGDLVWAFPLGIALSVLMILALAVVLTRRKIGVYAAGAVTVAVVAINLYLRLPVSTVLIGLTGVGVLIALLAPRWSTLR